MGNYEKVQNEYNASIIQDITSKTTVRLQQECQLSRPEGSLIIGGRLLINFRFQDDIGVNAEEEEGEEEGEEETDDIVYQYGNNLYKIKDGA